MNELQKKNNTFTPLCIFASVMVLWMDGGIINFFPFQVYIKGFSLILFFIFACLKSNKFIFDYIRLSLPIIIFLLINIFVRLIGFSDFKGIKDSRSILYLLIMVSLYTFYSKEKRIKEIKFILIIWLLDMFVSGIRTIVALKSNAYLSRFLSTGDPSQYIDVEFLRNGYLSFANAYGMLIVAMCLMLLLNKKNLVKTACIVIFFTYLLLKMQFVLAILFLVGFVVFYFVIRLNNRFKGAIGLSLLVFFLIVIFLPNILNLIINTIKSNSELKNKLIEINNWLSGVNINNTDLNSRFMFYKDSFTAIFENYFLGKAMINNGNVGGHSEILDILAVYGLMSIPLFVFFIRFYKDFKKNIEIDCAKKMKIILIWFLALSIVNTTFFAAELMAIIIIIPFLIILNQVEFGVGENESITN